MSNAEEGIRRLQDLPLLQSMSPETRERVAQLLWEVSERIDLAPGAVLLQEGDVGGDGGFVLIEGVARIDKESGERLNVPAPTLLGEMLQFNPRARRSATVRAEGPAAALRFVWQEFYARARERLTPQEQRLFIEAMMRSVCERFKWMPMTHLPLLQTLPEGLKVRVCLLWRWIGQRMTLPPGAVLFDQNTLCGDMGYLLTHGAAEVRLAGKRTQTVAAPNLLGVFPDFDPDLKWSATATIKEDAEILKFPWLHYLALLDQSVSASDRRRFNEAVHAGIESCFAH